MSCFICSFIHCSSQADPGNALVEVPSTPRHATADQVGAVESSFTENSLPRMSQTDEIVSSKTERVASSNGEEDTMASCFSNVGVYHKETHHNSEIVTESDILNDSKKMYSNKSLQSSPPADTASVTVSSDVSMMQAFAPHSPRGANAPVEAPTIYSQVQNTASLFEHTSSVMENSEPSCEKSVEVHTVEGPKENAFPNQPPHPVSISSVVILQRAYYMNCGTYMPSSGQQSNNMHDADAKWFIRFICYKKKIIMEKDLWLFY